MTFIENKINAKTATFIITPNIFYSYDKKNCHRQKRSKGKII